MKHYGLDLSSWRVNQGASPREVKELSGAVGRVLSVDYSQMLMEMNGGEGPLGNINLRIHSTAEVVAFNEDYGVTRRLEGQHLAFGTDGGDYCFTFDYSVIPPAVASFPLGALALDEKKLLASSVSELFARIASGSIQSHHI